jgi:hypothetical protein
MMEEVWFTLSALVINLFPIAGFVVIAFCLRNGRIPYFTVSMHISKSDNPLAFYGYISGLFFTTCLLAVFCYRMTESAFAG